MAEPNFEISKKIEYLKKLKEKIDATIIEIDSLKAAKDEELSFYEGVSLSEETKKIKEDIERDSDAKINRAKMSLKGYIALIDDNIINDANMQAILIADDPKLNTESLQQVIEALTSKAIQDAAKNVGAKEIKTAKTMEQLEAIKEDRLDNFHEKYDAAEALVEEENRFNALKKLIDGKKDPKVELEKFKTASEAKIAEIAELDGAKEYIIADEIIALQEKTDKKRGKPRYNKEADKKFDEILKHLELLSGTDLDKEIEVQGMGKVKLSELAQKGINDKVVKSNVLKAILPLVKDQEKIKEALELKSQAKKQEMVQLVDENKDVLGLVDADGKRALDIIKELLGKEDFSTADYKVLLDKVINDRTFKELEDLAKTNPDKFKGAKEAFEKLKYLKEHGYDGSEVGEKYERKGLSLEFLGRNSRIANDIDFNDPKPEDLKNITNKVYNTVYNGKNVSEAEQKRLRKLVEDEYNIGKLTSSRGKPYHIPILSDLKRLFGFKTAQDKWYEDLLKQKIHGEIRLQVEGKLYEDDKAAHPEKRAAWELDQAQAKKFREAERRLVVEGKGSADLAAVKKQAETEALKEDERE